MKLRPYQSEALTHTLKHLALGHNPVLQLATGTGKSLIIAALADAERVRHPVWVLTHVQQLVGQNAATYKLYTGLEPGIICAGLNRKDINYSVTFATIQSIMGMLDELPTPGIIIIDEAHRVPHNEDESTLYETILRKYPSARRVAMTATPWRMDNGIIYGSGDKFWFDVVAYKYTVPQAVRDGWLSPLVGVETSIQLDVDDVSVQGDFRQTEVCELETDRWLYSVAKSVMYLAVRRNHIAVYCPTVSSAERTAHIINQVTGWQTDVLSSSTKDRLKTITSFYNGDTRVLCSVDMITTGFDFPALDCIVCLRPTLSSSLWVQIQGRGTRLSKGKKNCLVLDYVGNLLRLGGVDMYETFYREKGMVEVEAVPTRPYVKKERTVYPGVKTLTPIDPMTGEDALNGAELVVTVHNVNCVALRTRRYPYPVLMINYVCTTPENARIDATQFINTTIVTDQTATFFRNRRLAVRLPIDAKDVTWQLKGAARPKTITVKKSGKYWNVISEQFNEDVQ